MQPEERCKVNGDKSMSYKSYSIVAAAALALCGGAINAQANQIANGGFEIGMAGDATQAAGWLGSPSYTRDCTVSHTGNCSAMLMAPALGAGGAEQNSGKDGGLDPLFLGEVARLSFWAKGFQGSTGNFLAKLQYLDASGASKYTSEFQSFSGGLSATTWNQFFITGAAVAQEGLFAFVQVYQPIGPIGTGPAGENWLKGQVWVDDVSVVPEPESYAMMLAGLGVVGTIVRRRRRSI